MPKLGGVESPFFRGNLNLSGYSGFNAGLLHPGIGPPSTPFVPPNHLTSFAPKVRLQKKYKKFEILYTSLCIYLQ